jgi:hypothetical protein
VFGFKQARNFIPENGTERHYYYDWINSLSRSFTIDFHLVHERLSIVESKSLEGMMSPNELKRYLCFYTSEKRMQS